MKHQATSTKGYPVDDSFSRLVCATCGCAFGAVPEWVASRRQSHAEFFCPNGHSLKFFAETEAERLKKQLAHANECRAAAVSAQIKAERALRRTKKAAK